MTFDAQKSRAFSEALLNWYTQNARSLPWRFNKDPYRILVSELMLQQTRVDTVIPYYERFMKEVPTIFALAQISDEKLLKLWQGLGYYSRAKNLKRAAIEVVERFDGKIPQNYKEVLALPGIGTYTAGAVLSIAFDKKITAVDGNVIRVISRIAENDGDVKDPNMKKKTVAVVEALLPDTRVGDFNQALMELGATICFPRAKAQCAKCPVQQFCKAYEKGRVHEIPQSKSMKRRIENKTLFFIHFQQKIAMRQRSQQGLLAGMWEFPHAEGELTVEESKAVLSKWHIIPKKMIELKRAKHIFTHVEWHMKAYTVFVDSILDDDLFSFKTKTEIQEKVAVPSVFKGYRNEYEGEHERDYACKHERNDEK